MAEGLGRQVMFSHAERSPANGPESDAVEAGPSVTLP
jgi:hypothetical protein